MILQVVITVKVNETPIEKEIEVKVETPAPAPAPAPEEKNISSNDERIKASPLAKKLADEKGIDLSNISGSGDGGRIIRKDIEEYKGIPAKTAEVQKEIKLPQIQSYESFENTCYSNEKNHI